MAANILRAYRWQFLFARETRPPFEPVLSAMLIGQFFNNVLLPWLPRVTWLRSAILAIALAAAMLVVIVVLARFRTRPVRFLLRPFARVPLLSPQRADQAAENLVRGLAAIRRPRLAFAAFALTTSSWIVFGLSAWLVMQGFDLGRDLSLPAGILVMIALALGMILPSSPAAVGVFEAATLVAMKAYGIPNSRALSYALVLHALNFLPYIAAGLLLLHAHAISLRGRPRAQ